jgi:MFS family permease
MQSIKAVSAHTFSSFQIPNFRKYFLGQVISTSGTWMQNVAQGLLILQLTGSGTALGILVALQFLPLLFFGSFAGVIADRFSKRKIFSITQSIFVLLAILHGLFVVLGLREVWMVYTLGLCLGLVTAIDNPTKQSFIFELVGKDQIKNAISLNSVMVNTAKVIGPAITAILVPLVGLAWCFFLNAVSFIAVLFVLYKIDASKLHTVTRLTQVKGELTKGLRYAVKTPTIRNVLLMMVIIGTFTFEYQVILPLFAEFTFHEPSTGYAILMTAMGVGAVAGGLYSASRRKTSMKSLIVIAFLFGCIMLLASVTPNLLVASIVMIPLGFFSINFNTLSNSMLQIHSKAEMRGRILSLWSIAFLGTTPIGGPIIGYIGEHFGARWGLTVGGIAAIMAGVVVYFLRKKEDKEKIVPTPTSPQQISVS